MNGASPEHRRPSDETLSVSRREQSESFPAPESAKSPRPLTYHFEELASGQRIVLIRHHGQEYRLTATKTGKLVLNK